MEFFIDKGCLSPLFRRRRPDCSCSCFRFVVGIDLVTLAVFINIFTSRQIILGFGAVAIGCSCGCVLSAKLHRTHVLPCKLDTDRYQVHLLYPG